MISLSFASGTIEIRGLDPLQDSLPSSCVWDDRTRCHRAPGMAYADVVRALSRAGRPYEDLARRYLELEEGPRVRSAPRPYQSEALSKWLEHRGRGVVVLPTGAGKSHLALLAIGEKRRSTLVVAPTLDLVRQWYDLLRAHFALPIGLAGGGSHDIQALTVTTYDSAYLHMENLGARFGLIVFDECHHLPSASYALAARLCIAPFRLGLSATPERADGREAELSALIGPTVYRRDTAELAGEWLAEYDLESVEIALSPEERSEYEAERRIYLDYVRKSGVRLGTPSGWSELIMRASGSVEGRRALAGHRRQKELATAAPAKLDYLEHLLDRHKDDPLLVFTNDNATAYRVSRRFLLPVITHQTKVRERSRILEGLRDGTFGAVVTSKVLNEGVDVPAARVAIVLSGSGSAREHVQRLGRILRKHGEKRAILYELVSAGTAETFTSERRNRTLVTPVIHADG